MRGYGNACGGHSALCQHSRDRFRPFQGESEVVLPSPHRIGMTRNDDVRRSALLDGLLNLWQEGQRFCGQLVGIFQKVESVCRRWQGLDRKNRREGPFKLGTAGREYTPWLLPGTVHPDRLVGFPQGTLSGVVTDNHLSDPPVRVGNQNDCAPGPTARHSKHNHQHSQREQPPPHDRLL